MGKPVSCRGLLPVFSRNASYCEISSREDAACSNLISWVFSVRFDRSSYSLYFTFYRYDPG